MSSKPLQIKTINPDNVYGESIIYSQPIVSDTQPTIESLGTQLWEGLIWYNPTLNVTKMYTNGEFLQINIEGGIDASYIVSGVLDLNRIPVLTDDKLPIVPIASGGTGASTAANALTNLGAVASSGGTLTNGIVTRPTIYDATIRSGLNENTDASSYPRIEFRRSGNTTDKYRFSAVYYSDANSSGEFNTIVSKEGAFLPNHALKSSVEYASGDSYAITTNTPVSGFINESKSIYFTVFTTKSLKNISSCSISIFTGNLRGINGAINSSTIPVTYTSSSDYTVTATKVSDNAIRIILTKTTAFTNSTADTPVVFYGQLTINFS